MSRPRLPRLALLAWVVALATLAGLGVAVAHYLGDGPSGMHGMPGMAGMQHTAADALSRVGGTEPLTPFSGSVLFTAWQLNALALAVIVLLGALYLTGVALVPVRTPGVRWPLHRTATFLAGLAVCAYATNGSIAVYDQVLFTAHMAGHLALVMVAPALLVAGGPLQLTLLAVRPKRRARIERIARGRVVSLLTAPPVALATYAAVIVGSHLTGLMDTIMRNTWAGQVEHLVYLLAGYQFFVLIVGNEPIRWRLSPPARWLLLAIGMAVDTFTGIVLMQGTRAVELMHSGLDVNALSDTRTGGAIMWFGGDAIMALIMVGLVVGWLRTVERAPAEKGWLEQARGATFAAHTGTTDGAPVDDEDEAARTAYNDWLARLDR
ncbi:MAG: cytochrome c oxidase assembly protein [Actinobacteria bacterium]|nr:cytochrome c oxidase assembly protein [Actinomycetota bacterium]